MSRTLSWVVLAVAALALVPGCGNSPVAIVNNVRITQSQFNERMVAAVGRDILKDMVDRELIRQAAEQAGIVRRILVEEGEKLAVGTCLGVIAAEDEELEPATTVAATASEASSPAQLDGCAAEYLVDDYREALLWEQ